MNDKWAPKYKIANYNIESGACTADRLVIRDIGPWDRYKTITNEIESVVRILVHAGELRDGMKFFYYDSEGELTGVEFSGSEFVGFYSPDRIPW